jgi:predicted TPR repeat methyltransferase
MMENKLQAHWEDIYTKKTPNQVSWTQKIPVTSIEMIQSFQLPLSASIIDIGGGDSLLVDHLLDLGYTDITVLDISSTAILKAKNRLGEKAVHVHWIVSDILDFEPERIYDLWHDRAAFHFLTQQIDIGKYVDIVTGAARNLVIGTFSVDGPFKCSGLEVKQYDESQMCMLFEDAGFIHHECKRVNHITPAQVVQNFIFCSFS